MLSAHSDLGAALTNYQAVLEIMQRLTTADPSNSQWQHDLSSIHQKVGDVLSAQGDHKGALLAYRQGFRISEALSARDPTSTQWQSNVAVFCSRLGTLDHGVQLDERRAFLVRGKQILMMLKKQGRLPPSQDWTAWFEQELSKLPAVR